MKGTLWGHYMVTASGLTRLWCKSTQSSVADHFFLTDWSPLASCHWTTRMATSCLQKNSRESDFWKWPNCNGQWWFEFKTPDFSMGDSTALTWLLWRVVEQSSYVCTSRKTGLSCCWWDNSVKRSAQLGGICTGAVCTGLRQSVFVKWLSNAVCMECHKPKTHRIAKKPFS